MFEIFHRDEYSISTDPAGLDLGAIHSHLVRGISVKAFPAKRSTAPSQILCVLDYSAAKTRSALPE
jgi:hypothetical protein